MSEYPEGLFDDIPRPTLLAIAAQPPAQEIDWPKAYRELYAAYRKCDLIGLVRRLDKELAQFGSSATLTVTVSGLCETYELEARKDGTHYASSFECQSFEVARKTLMEEVREECETSPS